MASGRKYPIRQTVAMVMTASVVAAVGPARAESAASRPKAPFKVLYSNDATHITCCLSPYRQTESLAWTRRFRTNSYG